jgi:hypothetical protein
MQKPAFSPKVLSAVALAAVIVALALVPHCVTESNPYLDKGKAGCEFVGLPNDTVPIFYTFSFTIDALLAAHLREIGVHVDGNRLWGREDTTVEPEALKKLKLYVSFADTGLHVFRLVGKLANGDTIVRLDTLYARSPLSQSDVVYTIGETIRLQTPKVIDTDVLYVWDFKQGQFFVSDTPETAVVFDRPLIVTSAELYVKSGVFRSPSRFFSITPRDKPPVIWPIVPSQWQDTVGTPSLKIRIGAKAESGIASVLLNDSLMTRDRVDTVFFREATFNEGRNVLRIKSKDNTGVRGIDSLVIYYDRNAVDITPPKITITEPAKIAHIADTIAIVRGSAVDAGGISSLKVNGVDASRDYPNWYATISLTHGYDTIRVVAKDSSNRRNQSADSVIVIQNRPPEFVDAAATLDTLLWVGQPYAVTIRATDSDQDALAIEQLKIAKGSTFGASNGAAIISYTPAESGIDTFRLAVSDVWNDGDTLTWQVFVPVSGDSTPFFTTDSTKLPDTLTALGHYSASVRALDPSHHPITYSLLKPPSPAGMTIDNQGAVRWSALEGDTGSFRVLVQADNGARYDTLGWTVAVRPLNWPPALVCPDSMAVDKMKLLQFPLSATDKNGDSLDFRFGAVFPSGARLDGNQFIWTPGADDVGRYRVEFVVRERNRIPALSDAGHTLITVNNPFGPPVIINPGDTTIPINRNLTVDLSALYYDNTLLEFSLGNALAGAALTVNHFSWTPDISQVGRHALTFIVYDSKAPAMRDSAVVSITVVTANVAPVLVDPGDQTVDENSVLAFNLTATDADGDSIKITMKSPLSDSLLEGNRFSWKPTYLQGGEYTVNFFATDNGGPPLSDSQAVVIRVSNVNAPPVLAKLGDKSGSIKQLLSFGLSATDVDIKDTLLYTMENGPDGATLDSNVFEWTPAIDQIGTHQVSFIAWDNGTPALSDTETIVITVLNVNRPPVANAGADRTAGVNTSVVLDGRGSFDLDNAGITYAWTQTAGAAVTLTGATTAQPRFTPTIADTCTFRLTVSDGAAQNTDDVTIAVVSQNLLTNGDFSEGGASWASLIQSPPQSPPLGSISYQGGTAKFTINTAGTQPWQFQLYQTIKVTAGASYNFSFEAARLDSDPARDIEFVVQTHVDPYTEDIKQPFTIHRDWETFTGKFTASTTRLVRIAIWAGLNDLDFYVRNFEVTQK